MALIRPKNLPANSLDLSANFAFTGAVTGAGNVLQVQEYQAHAAYMEISTDTFTATNMTVTITPKFTTSKIILHGSWGYWLTTDSNNYCVATIYKGSTNLAAGAGSYNALSWHGPMRNSGYNNHATIDHINSPNTTSATTYTIYVRPLVAATSSLRVQWSSQQSFLSATEIKA